MDGSDSNISSDEEYYRELEKIKSNQQQQPPPPQKPAFKLSLGGLGFSNLVKENGKTQEELDVDAQVAKNKEEKK